MPGLSEGLIRGQPGLASLLVLSNPGVMLNPNSDLRMFTATEGGVGAAPKTRWYCLSLGPGIFKLQPVSANAMSSCDNGSFSNLLNSGLWQTGLAGQWDDGLSGYLLKRTYVAFFIALNAARGIHFPPNYTSEVMLNRIIERTIPCMYSCGGNRDLFRLACGLKRIERSKKDRT